LHAT
jgi:hypothetical protein